MNRKEEYEKKLEVLFAPVREELDRLKAELERLEAGESENE